MLLMRLALLGLMAISVPTSLAPYRSWHELTKEPHLVPSDVSTLCLAPIPPESNSPHGARWIRVYANPIALEALQAHRDLPPGSVVAKEKRPEVDGEVEGVAFMIKHGKGAFTRSNGWEFRYYPSNGEPLAFERCAACHRAGAKQDYVFTKAE